jgi:hypothetical protein
MEALDPGAAAADHGALREAAAEGAAGGGLGEQAAVARSIVEWVWTHYYYRAPGLERVSY